MKDRFTIDRLRKEVATRGCLQPETVILHRRWVRSWVLDSYGRIHCSPDIKLDVYHLLQIVKQGVP